MQKAKPEELFAIDPRTFQPFAPAASKYPEPPYLPGSTFEERTTLVAHVVRDLRDHPQTERSIRSGALVVNAFPTWDRIRSLPVRADGADEVINVEQLLSRDGAQPVSALLFLMTWLLDVRAKLDVARKQVQQLEAVERAFGAQAERLAPAAATA